jgi:hypothetical protein
MLGELKWGSAALAGTVPPHQDFRSVEHLLAGPPHGSFCITLVSRFCKPDGTVSRGCTIHVHVGPQRALHTWPVQSPCLPSFSYKVDRFRTLVLSSPAPLPSNKHCANMAKTASMSGKVSPFDARAWVPGLMLGQTVFVTGGSTGLGKEIAKAVAAQGK